MFESGVHTTDALGSNSEEEESEHLLPKAASNGKERLMLKPYQSWQDKELVVMFDGKPKVNWRVEAIIMAVAVVLFVLELVKHGLS